MPLVRLTPPSVLSFLVACAVCHSTAIAESPGSTWPQWRGVAQNGVASAGTFPLKWSEVDGAPVGIRWKAEIPGLGGSTPITNDKTAFLTTGVDGKNKLMAINIESGDVEWQADIGDDMGKKHKKGGGSNPSAITDGKHIYAFFRSGDLGCVDLTGKVVWQKSIKYDAKEALWWDLGTSPILTNDAVVVTVMHTGPSYLVAFDKLTGKELWKADRNVSAPKEAAQSYATPLNVVVKGGDAIAVMGADHLTLHSAADGRELGRLGGFNPTSHEYFRSISSPVAEGNIIICPYARGDSVTAVDMDALASGAGKDAILWFRDDLGSDVPTPAIKDGRVYFIDDGKQTRGLVSCVNIKTGETVWEVQIDKSRIGYSSSPLVAGDHLYVTQENATTHVIGPLSSGEPKIVSTNRVNDSDQFTVASPAPAGNALLIRSKHSLYQVSQ